MCDINCTFQNATKEHLLHHIKNNIPTKLTFDQIYLLPKREDYLDAKLKAAINHQINNKKPIIFMPNDVLEKNDWVNGGLVYKIYITGVLPCGSKLYVRLDNVEVYFEIMVPDNEPVNKFQSYICGNLINRDISFTGVNIIKKFKLKGFQDRERNYLKITFKNLQDRKKAIELINSLNKTLISEKMKPIETSHDDLGNYFPVVAREKNFNTANWNRITDYIVETNITTNCSYFISVDVNSYNKLSNKLRQSIVNLTNNPMSQVIDRDPTMVCQYDIETYRAKENGMVPTPKDTDFTIFMMCSAFFWHYTDTPLVTVCAVEKDCETHKNIMITIVCGTEENVLKAHMHAVSIMAPDINAAFNGANFDTPLYIEKLKRAGLLVELKDKYSTHPICKNGKYIDTESSILKWNIKTEKIKINAETNHEAKSVMIFPGMIDTDVMAVFLKLYPNLEVRKSFSLNFFLKDNGLESKEDMPYKKMFKIYERALKLEECPKQCHCDNYCEVCTTHVKEIDYIDYDISKKDLLPEIFNNGTLKCCHCSKRKLNLKDMADVGYYCIIDCIRPQQLYVKRTVIPDKREVSNMARVTLYDSFYRADGMKVRNLIGRFCNKMNIAFSNAKISKSNSERCHFPGGWVFPPFKGLHKDRPITGLDFSSLYPSLKMAYNLSPDMIVYTKEQADELISKGYNLYKIEDFEYEIGEKKGNPANIRGKIGGWVVRHNGITRPGLTKIVEKYDKVITYKYNDKTIEVINDEKVPDECGPEFTKTIQYKEVYGRDALPGERMGVTSFVVKKLFDKRKPIKAEVTRINKLLEVLELKNKAAIAEGDFEKSSNIEKEMRELCFIKNKIDSKQKAIKVFANTFYGELGNFRSPIFELLIAGGVTCAGQKNIKMVAEYIKNKKFKVQYGDTDSLYLNCPESVFEECDKEYLQTLEDLKNKFSGIRIQVTGSN